VDDAAVDEPGQRVTQGRQALEWETIFEVIGVHEIEGVLEVDVVRVMASRSRIGDRDRGQ
jgi:hypothetical protein